MLARAHKKFLCEQHSEIYLLTLKEQDKTKMELPLDMVSISASICRTINAFMCMYEKPLTMLFSPELKVIMKRDAEVSTNIIAFIVKI